MRLFKFPVCAEIVAFCQFLEPTPEEATMRQEAVDRIAELVTSIFPSAKVKPFGSFVTGLLSSFPPFYVLSTRHYSKFLPDC